MTKGNRRAWFAGLLLIGGLLGLGLAAWHHRGKAPVVAPPGVSAPVAASAPANDRIPAAQPAPASPTGVSRLSTLAKVTTKQAPRNSRPRGQAPTNEEVKWTAEAHPSPKTSMLLLDLSRPPSEKELRMAGQLGEELQPIGPADPAAVADPTARKRLESINTDFGRAIQEWNKHNYDLAQGLFLNHLTAYPDSPWAAESELHLGCACQYLGKLDESQKWFEAAQSRAPAGDPMTGKATLRLGALAMDQGALDRATQLFARLKATADTPAHATYASYWIRALSLMKAKQSAMRDCGQKSLGEICALKGQDEAARALRSLPASGPDGFSLEDLEQVACQHGLEARTVVSEKHRLEDLPLPFIAHYQRDQHFVAVLSREQNGRIRIYDTRVGHTLEAEAGYVKSHWSGFALVFALTTAESVRLASVQEKKEAVGGCCGLPRYPDDLGTCETGGCSDCSRGMPAWSVNPANMNLVVSDTPMWWDAPYGPSISFNLTYNSLDSLISVRPFGDKWTLNYAEYAIVDPSENVMIVRGNAKAERFSHNINGSFTPDPHIAAKKLQKLGDYDFELEESDGTKFRYSIPPNLQGQSVASLLTSITDRYGNTVSILHNTQGAVIGVRHSALSGEANKWEVHYDQSGRVSYITDPFSREATFSYDANGHLTGQTDMGEVAYGYTYTTAAQVRERDPENPEQFVTRTNELFVNSIVTPTGTTAFYTEPADGISNGAVSYPDSGQTMWENYRITVTDPLEYVEEYFFDGYHQVSWHRDKNHYSAGQPGNIKTVYHFTWPTGDSKGEISGTEYQGGVSIASDQFTAGGNPQWVTGSDGRTDEYTYNAQGNILTHTTADGILYTYEYAANGLDVVRTKRTVDTVETTISQTVFDPVTRDVTSSTDQAGLTTNYARNALGQLTSVTDARGNITSYEYDAQGRTQTVKYKPAGRANPITLSSYVYDNIGRLAGQTDMVGYPLLFEYDDLNRRVKTTYPDNSTSLNNYSCCTLDSTTARDGSTTQYTYDAMKRVTSIVSPGAQVLNYSYDKVGNLIELHFGRGEGVRWEFDAANRMTAKVYPDGTRQSYSYDAATGRPISSTDAQNRTTIYEYDTSGRLASVYTPGLPTQSFIYDTLGRRLTWADGARTTSYTYDDLGRITNIQLPDDEGTVTRVFDQWGRLDHWTYGATDETPGTETYTYDDLDRTATVTNPLGTFTPVYDGDTTTTTRLNYPVAGIFTQFTRLGVNQDLQLSQILHQGTAGELARFDYEYDASGGISKWSASQVGLTAPRQWGVGYDPAHQMTSVEETPRGSAPGTVPQRVWRYAYDASGNRTAAQEDGRTTTGLYNNLNQLTQLSPSGSTWFRGKVNEAAQVTVAGKPARVSGDGTFEAILALGPGVHDVPIQATDKAGNMTDHVYRVDNGTDAPRSCSFDPCGNMLGDGQRAFTWDARNKLAGLTKGTDTWTYNYDGGDFRRSEEKNGIPQRTWIWNGTSLHESKEASSGARYRFWSYGAEVLNAQGQQVGRRYLLRDHLRSVRVVADESGAIQASYDYSAWGRRTKLSGSGDWPQGYSGYWEDETGLVYYGYRYYYPEPGRWPSRDPLQEVAGTNLYEMVQNGPISLTDLLGLRCRCDPKKVEQKILEYSRIAAKKTAAAPWQTRFEWGGYVCCQKSTGNVLATDPEPGPPGGPIKTKINGQDVVIGYTQAGSKEFSRDGCERKFGPTWELAGIYHSHPGSTPFSPKDLNLSGAWDVPIGLGDPNTGQAMGAYGLPVNVAGPVQGVR